MQSVSFDIGQKNQKKLEKKKFFLLSHLVVVAWLITRTTNCLNASWSFFGNTRFFGTAGAACTVVALPLTCNNQPRRTTDRSTVSAQQTQTRKERKKSTQTFLSQFWSVVDRF
jgi:hypothetical protein